MQVLKGVSGQGDGYLLIDDLVDTGKTAQAVRQLLPKAHFACLYAKPAGRPIVDTFVKEFKQTKWIHFPWDIEYTLRHADQGRRARLRRAGLEAALSRA